MITRDVLMASIRVAHGRRPVSPETVARLVESIRDLAPHRPMTKGLINPVVLRDTGGMLHLISGLHRLQAFKALGHDEIRATVLTGIDADTAELEEIDENLCRNDLSMAEADIAMARRAEIIKGRAAREGDSGVPIGTPLSRQSQRGGGKVTGPDPASVRDLAKRTGRSTGDIQRSRKRVESLGTQTLGRIIGTSLDGPSEAAALAKLPEPEREAVVVEAEAQAVKPEPERKKVSAVALVRQQREVPMAPNDAPRLAVSWPQGDIDEDAAIEVIAELWSRASDGARENIIWFAKFLEQEGIDGWLPASSLRALYDAPFDAMGFAERCFEQHVKKLTRAEFNREGVSLADRKLRDDAWGHYKWLWEGKARAADPKAA